MAFFGRGKDDRKSPMIRLQRSDYQGPGELRRLINDVLSQKGLRARDVSWSLCSPRGELRMMGLKVLKSQSHDYAKLLLNELQGKSNAEMRNLMLSAAEFDSDVVTNVAQTLMAESNSQLREKGFFLVRQASRDKTQALLGGMLKGTDPEAQVVAIDLLKDDPEGLRRVGLGTVELQRMCENEDERVRKAGFDLLNAMTQRTRHQDLLLLKGITDDSYQIQSLCARTIGGLLVNDDEEIESGLISLLADGRNAVRTAVVETLSHCPEPRRVIRRYLNFIKDLPGWVRERALDSLKSFGDRLLDPIVELMGDSNREIKLLALGIGGTFEDERCVAPIIGMLSDEDWWTRITAAETLGRIGDKRAVDPLIRALDDKDVQWAAIEALSMIKDKRAITPIARFLNHEADEVRMATVEALSAFEDPGVVKALQDRVKNDPSAEVQRRCIELIREIAEKTGSTQDVSALVTMAAERARGRSGGKLDDLLIRARQQHCSDVHISVGLPPLFRSAGVIEPLEGQQVLDAAAAKRVLCDILTEPQLELLEKEQQIDFCYVIPNVGRYRANIFIQRLGMGGVFRIIPGIVPTFRDVGLPDYLTAVTNNHQGMIIVSGPAGSGKSTTLAALVNLINERKRSHILSVEEPVEFVHTMKQSLVNQREVHKHTQSFANALRGALREDPDIIVIGDMRDPEVISMALEAAETGHLVIGTMNTTSAHKTVDRVIESFPPNEQDAVRLALSETLRLVICQRLLPRADQPGQVACFEILPCVQNVRTLIRDDKVYQLPGIMELGRSQGMRTADMSLEALMDAGKITPEDAYIRAVKKETFEGMVSAQFLAEIQALEPPKIDDDPSGDGRGPMPSGNPAPSVGSSI
ncbi:MAG: hypothetical protein CMH50_07520 [Myxococcales bacterium]|nr:hypothetical protein [Myxococcales bacterium]